MFAVMILAGPAPVAAQGTPADYERALGLRTKYEGLAVNLPGAVTWIGATSRFWFRNGVRGGNEFVVYDAATLARKPAFDHEKIAGALAAATGGKHTALRLPFNTITFVDNERAFEATFENNTWRCEIADSTCKKTPPRGPRGGFTGPPPACVPASPDDTPRVSPNGKWEGLIANYNVVVREPGKPKTTLLSSDGSEGNCYQLSSLVWSPDSGKLAAYRVKPGYRRMVTYVESSPEDQLQPKTASRFYAKPGDVLDLEQPVIFHLEAKRQVNVDNALFPNPYDLTPLVWRDDNRGVTFEYNQRGHQVYRVMEVNAASGAVRAVISEEPRTFFNYRTANGSLGDSGKKYRFDLGDGKEVVWMSERDGWNHLYLMDGETGAVKNQITSGNWVVRGVVNVDAEKRQLLFSAGGVIPGKDPYFAYYFRVNLDGSGLTRLSQAEANHTAVFSQDRKYYVDTFSRVDMPPVMELRRTEDNVLLAEVQRGDITALRAAGWKPPEVFTAMGRDGKTDIWGVIFRPTNFDPTKKYPVVENIYAGPQGSFVPKTFSPYSQMQSQAELGFIVVQIDGMGTSNRSKGFHEVAWKNLGDAGFPDRILWHKAVAAKYPWYDTNRVGLYGTSAGGQNSMGGLLFHPEFYKAAVSAAGCHDNRMDKIWWNEQWMGWPVGPEYSTASNVDNAWRLQGKLLLVVGEMDTNVDPSSTMQVVNQLYKHNKDFDLLYVPGMGHSAGGAFGERKRYDFFVRYLLGVAPPAWPAAETRPAGAAAAASQVSFSTQDGGTVTADVYGTGERGVVLAHGGRFNKSSWEKQARTLADAGFRVLAIDFRGYGQSQGPGQVDPMSAPLHLDVLAAVRYLQQNGVKSVAVVGGSMGGSAAAGAAVAARGEIDRLVLLGAAPSRDAGKLRGRKLLIVTRDDRRGDGQRRLPEIRAQYDKMPHPKELVVLEGAAHAQAMFETDQGERVISEILRFLKSQR
jgi:dipeptidyl aminopeptidase/acylaminoacyl peptidase